MDKRMWCQMSRPSREHDKDLRHILYRYPQPFVPLITVSDIYTRQDQKMIPKKVLKRPGFRSNKQLLMQELYSWIPYLLVMRSGVIKFSSPFLLALKGILIMMNEVFEDDLPNII